MLLHTVAILLVHAVLAVHGGLFHHDFPASDIKSLCEDRSVALLTITELEYLKSVLDAPGAEGCSSSVKAAIPHLLDLIEQTKDDLCAQESVDKLRDFYSKYLDTSSEQNKHREQLPKSLRKFALAYGMQMSSNCKRRMVSVLSYTAGDVLYEDTHKAIRGLVGNRSPVASMLGGLTGPDEYLMPGDLAPFIKYRQEDHRANQEDSLIFVQSATGSYIRKMQADCNEFFAPIYRPLIKPIVQLANLGFNYKDEPLRNNMRISHVSGRLTEWSRLVFLCESLNNIRMIDSRSEDAKIVRLLTKEEADAIEHKSTSLSELQSQVVEREYDPVGLQDGPILNKEDKQLKKAIKAFKTSKSEEEKIAKRMMGKGVTMVRAQLKLHNIGLLVSSRCNSLMHRIRAGEKLKPSDEIAKILDGAEGHESEFLDRPNEKLLSTLELVRDIGTTLTAVVLGILCIAIIGMIGAVLAIPAYLLRHYGGIASKDPRL